VRLEFKFLALMIKGYGFYLKPALKIFWLIFGNIVMRRVKHFREKKIKRANLAL